MTTSLNLSRIIAPGFYEVHRDIKNNRHTHYFIKGGRGSTKSSFVSIEIILGIMRTPHAHAIAFRKVGKDVKDSIFNQLLWAIDILEVNSYWAVNLSPLKLTYKPTGQTVMFRGVDDAAKSKSIKLREGYFGFVWFEEADQFSGMEEIRKILQSLLRSGKDQKVFYTYNPPQSVNNWINEEVLTRRTDRLTHHSTYLDVPPEWLGSLFFAEARQLKEVNEQAYNHEYMGEVTGTGGEVFKNVKVRSIPEDEILSYGRIYRGLDFGFTTDPTAYICCCLHNRRLYIFHEVYKTEMGFDKMAEAISTENKFNELVYADSAEPRSIHELAVRGIKITGARKYQGSVDHGITRLKEDLTEIVIDGENCPNAAREFLNYELERDREGNFKAAYPDKNNHAIDAVRYALCNTELFLKPKQTTVSRHNDFDILKPKKSGLGSGTDILKRR